jgi:hypothetical protein
MLTKTPSAHGQPICSRYVLVFTNWTALEIDDPHGLPIQLVNDSHFAVQFDELELRRCQRE